MKERRVLVVCLSPCFQRIMEFDHFYENEVNRGVSCFESISGKGVNVCRFLNSMGCNSSVIVHIDGKRRSEYLEIAQADGIPLIYSESPDGGIRTCTTIINKEKGTSTELVQENWPVSAETSNRILNLFSEALKDFSVVVISGTKASGYDELIYAKMVKEASERNIPVILDIKGNDLVEAVKYHPYLIKPNLAEFIATFTDCKSILENENTESLFSLAGSVCEDLFRKYGVRTVLSRGKFDAWYYDGDSMKVMPNKPIKPVNTIGCGDSLTAGIAKCISEGKTLEEALSFGMEAARIKAMTLRYN